MRVLLFLVVAVQIATTTSSQVVIKMKREGGVSIIPCKVNGLNLKFIFDTGASNVSISMTEASFMLKNDYLVPEDILKKSRYLDANGNISEGVDILLKEVEIGGLKLFNVKASVVTNMKAPLLLGQSVISKLGIIQLDWESNTLTILNPKDSINDDIATIEPVTSIDTAILDAGDEEGLDLVFKEANSNFDLKSYQEAINNLDELLQKNPKHVGALMLRGLSYDMLEDYKSAIENYTKVIAINQKNYTAYCYRGKSKYDLEDYSGALKDLNQGLLINPKFKQGYLWRAETKDKQKNYLGAVQDYDKLIILDPKDSSLYVNRSFIKHNLKDYKGAIVDCNKAISINNEYADAYYSRGLSKKYLRDNNSAIEDLDKAIDLDPEHANAYAARAHIKEIYEDYEGALQDYNKSLEINPEYLYASLMKSFLEEKMKRNVWIKVSSTEKGDRWYLYNSVVTKEYNSLKIWVKCESKSMDSRKNGKPITIANGYSLMLCLFHCTNKEYKMLSIAHYDSKGNVVNSEEFEDYLDWKNAAPQTIIEMLISEACKRYN